MVSSSMWHTVYNFLSCKLLCNQCGIADEAVSILSLMYGSEVHLDFVFFISAVTKVTGAGGSNG